MESDSIGSLPVPADAYYGVQTLRAKENFHITGQRMNPTLIESLAAFKKAAALTNLEAGELDARRGQAIVAACDEVLAGRLHDQFIVDPIQGGAGTSANMNANEVLCNRAIELLGGAKGDYTVVHPNDHVNMSQSTNDVYPSAGKLTILRLLTPLERELDRLAAAFEQKGEQFRGIVKMGRTQLQDAVPVSLGQSFYAYAHAVRRGAALLEEARQELYVLNIGGTAIGTAINASPYYLGHIVEKVRRVTGQPFCQAEDLIDATQNLDSFVSVSGAVKACAVTLSKIASDLRLLSSGPKTGLGEISLPACQNGSSIMPGKVNPVIPEVVNQVAFNVIGNDFAVTMAAEAGQLELNAFEPILFYNIFESITTLANATATFVDHCVLGIRANVEQCSLLVEESTGIATALCPLVGYRRAAEIAKRSLRTGEHIRDIVVKEGILTPEQVEKLLDPMLLAHRPEA